MCVCVCVCVHVQSRRPFTPIHLHPQPNALLRWTWIWIRAAQSLLPLTLSILLPGGFPADSRGLCLFQGPQGIVSA